MSRTFHGTDYGLAGLTLGQIISIPTLGLFKHRTDSLPDSMNYEVVEVDGEAGTMTLRPVVVTIDAASPAPQQEGL